MTYPKGWTKSLPLCPLIFSWFSLLLQQKTVKNISTDNIPAILLALKVAISSPTTEHIGIWVGLLVTSSKCMAQTLKRRLTGFLSLEKHIWGVCAFIFLSAFK